MARVSWQGKIFWISICLQPPTALDSFKPLGWALPFMSSLPLSFPGPFYFPVHQILHIAWHHIAYSDIMKWQGEIDQDVLCLTDGIVGIELIRDVGVIVACHAWRKRRSDIPDDLATICTPCLGTKLRTCVGAFADSRLHQPAQRWQHLTT